jgi:hypothetical protein
LLLLLLPMVRVLLLLLLLLLKVGHVLPRRVTCGGARGGADGAVGGASREELVSLLGRPADKMGLLLLLLLLLDHHSLRRKTMKMTGRRVARATANHVRTRLMVMGMSASWWWQRRRFALCL